jgi:hypothetical protein
MKNYMPLNEISPDVRENDNSGPATLANQGNDNRISPIFIYSSCPLSQMLAATSLLELSNMYLVK